MSGLIPASEQPNNLRRRRLAASAPVALMCLVLMGVVAFGPAIAPNNPYQTHPGYAFAASSSAHWLGTDEFGRDILSRFLWGGQASLGGALLAWLIAAALGGALSLFALLGYTRLDRVVGYALDVMLAFPGLLVALIAVALLGTGTIQIAAAVGVSLAPTFARMMRGAITTVRSESYVTASVALGANRWWIATRHIVRNVAPPVLSVSAVILAWALLDYAALEFLGLAGSLENPTWGGMIGEGRLFSRQAIWMVLAPSLSLFLTVLCLTLAGNLQRLLSRSSG